MISVEQAVDAVQTYVGKFSNLMPTEDLRLEEFDLDGDDWAITLSFFEANMLTASRSFKTFIVDGQDARVLSMKIRNPFIKERV